MTNFDSREGYPVDHEVERQYGTDEVYKGVKGLEGFEISDGITFAVGRRAGKNAAKGFSTGDGKTYCPGAEDTKQRTADDIALTVAKSVLTTTRHALNPALGEVSDSKSDDYKAQQTSLAAALVDVARGINDDSIDESVDDDGTSVDAGMAEVHAWELYTKFMQRGAATEIDGAQLAESCNGVAHLIAAVLNQFNGDAPAVA